MATLQECYLDHNATTQPDESVVAAITNALQHIWGNPSSKSPIGQKASTELNAARINIAKMIGVEDNNCNDIVYTSGGTESNNLVFHSIVEDPFFDLIPHIITTNIEHPSVILPLEKLKSLKKIELTIVNVECNGIVSPDSVVNHIQSNTRLVTVMLANNETGNIQPIAEIGKRIHKINENRLNCKVFFHSDAAQAFGKIKVNVNELNVDYLTIVGHKFYGPRTGALYVRGASDKTNLYSSAPLIPMFFGGGQERGYRSGTENVPDCVGLGAAASLVANNLQEDLVHLNKIRDYLFESLKKCCKNVSHKLTNGVLEPRLNSNMSNCLCNTLNVSFIILKDKDMLLHPGHVTALSGYELVNRLGSHNVYVSAGSACHATSTQPSAVLIASGIKTDQAIGAVRISVGRNTTEAICDTAVSAFEKVLTDMCSSTSKSK